MTKKEKKPRILTFIDHYLPGYKFGGPTRTIANIVEHLGKEFEFLIFTRDRDFEESRAYDRIDINEWNTHKGAEVFYAAPWKLTPFGVYRFLKKTPHDLLYLNSFFSPTGAGVPLLFRRFGLNKDIPVIIAPRGQFASGALKIKSFKKSIYLRLAKLFGLYEGLIWQASSKNEAEDIVAALGDRLANKIIVAPDLLPVQQYPTELSIKSSGSDTFRLVFLSRISREKNLHFLLTTLQKVTYDLELNIYGPRKDMSYWTEIEDLIERLPQNISAKYCGEVMHKNVPDVFSKHDLFVFPTLGENFGHVIYESLSVGTPVLLSDQTPWQPDANGALEVLPLDSKRWTEAVNNWASINHKSLQRKKQAAVEYANDYKIHSNSMQQNIELFQTALDISD